MAVSNIAVIGYVDEPPLLEPPSLLAEIRTHNVEVRTESSSVDNMQCETGQQGMSSDETRQNAN